MGYIAVIFWTKCKKEPDFVWKSGSLSDLFIQIVALLEAIHTSAGIDQLLLAGKERMALGTDINAKVFLGGRRLDNFAACATDRGRLILGMNTLFHSCHLFNQI